MSALLLGFVGGTIAVLLGHRLTFWLKLPFRLLIGLTNTGRLDLGDGPSGTVVVPVRGARLWVRNLWLRATKQVVVEGVVTHREWAAPSTKCTSHPGAPS